MKPETLRARLEDFPRLKLAEYPTPLYRLSRLSAELGRELYIKRDDLIGPAMGGNKCRKLEYLMADAMARRAKRVVTFGGLQSNHARMTAAVARRCGIEPHLFFFEPRPDRRPGNLLLDELLGAHMHFVPFGGGGQASMTLETANRLVRWLARLRVGPHYFIPVGGHAWRGCLGYVQAACELTEQTRELGIEDAWVVVAAGSGGTLAGLLAGVALCGSQLKPLGIDVGKLWKGFPASIAAMAGELCARLGEPRHFAPADVPLVEGRYVGDGYGKPSLEGNTAIARLARSEGIVLDPIYTGKAFAGMLDLLERGELEGESPIVFLHTGGAPGLFAFPHLGEGGGRDG
ncbi:MAG: D-cysteine desulfhydrase family protein [Caldilineae bacterium]|nr:MAG: D-cysteine desulfhydrase family protein [Caldilineae bacterium]